MSAKMIKKKAPELSSPQQEPEIDLHRAGRLLQEIAVIVNNTVKHYWLSQDDAESDMADCYKTLVELLHTCPQMTVRILGSVPTVNGKPLELKDSLLDSLFAQLKLLSIDNFYVVEGVTSIEFNKFCDIISAKPDELKQLGGFSEVLDKFESKNIRTKKLIFHEIADAQVVISKDEFEKMGNGEGEGEGKATVGDILAFLKGDVLLKDDKLAETVKETASDPERMAELILQAAEIREKADVQGGETMGEFIVGCLRRMKDAVVKDPSIKTKTGNKKAVRNFIMLEEEILKRMREMSAEDANADDIDAVESAIDDITDEVKIDALADEYVSKVEAVEDSRNRLMTFVKQQESKAETCETVLQKKFAEKGIRMPGWQGMIIKSGGGGQEGPGGGFSNPHIMDAISRLDALLDTMEREFSKMSKAQQDEDAKKMWNILEEVNGEVQRLTGHTGVMIGNLVDSIRSDENVVGAAEANARSGGKDISLTRKQVLSTISDVLRDISEPLELIMTSLDMMTSKTVSFSAQMQANVLSMAKDNANLIKNLLDGLRTISPSTPPGDAAGGGQVNQDRA